MKLSYYKDGNFGNCFVQFKIKFRFIKLNVFTMN